MPRVVDAEIVPHDQVPSLFVHVPYEVRDEVRLYPIVDRVEVADRKGRKRSGRSEKGGEQGAPRLVADVVGAPIEVAEAME